MSFFSPVVSYSLTSLVGYEWWSLVCFFSHIFCKLVVKSIGLDQLQVSFLSQVCVYLYILYFVDQQPRMYIPHQFIAWPSIILSMYLERETKIYLLLKYHIYVGWKFSGNAYKRKCLLMQALKPSGRGCCKKAMEETGNMADSGNCKQQIVGHLAMLFRESFQNRDIYIKIIDAVIDVEKTIRGESTV